MMITQTHPRGSGDRFGVDWAGRRVAVVGLGKSGLAACRLLQQVGCRVRVTERHDAESLKALAARLREEGIEAIELGRHHQSFLEGCETLVVSPGVLESATPIQWAQANDVPILSELELAFRFCESPIIAVTGTNGKSSVVTLIHRALRAARSPAVACGNLGTPLSDVLPALTPQTIAVVEVSSFQLVWCQTFRPAIGVLLNLGTNHLDWHRDRASYLAAKARLCQRQTPHDYAVLNRRDPEIVRLSASIRAKQVWFGSADQQPAPFQLNAATCQALSDNAQAVLQVGRLLQIPDPLVHQVIREFRGLEHRLEYVATVRGVRVVNDSKSTTPDSFLYALVHSPGGVIPILGGQDKGLDFQPLKAALAQERVRGVVLIGAVRQRLRDLINGSTIVRESATLQDALQAAMALAHPGDTVLFSPACASFDMFRNFEDRGLAFKQLVAQLPNGLPARRHGGQAGGGHHDA